MFKCTSKRSGENGSKPVRETVDDDDGRETGASNVAGAPRFHPDQADAADGDDPAGVDPIGLQPGVAKPAFAPERNPEDETPALEPAQGCEPPPLPFDGFSVAVNAAPRHDRMFPSPSRISASARRGAPNAKSVAADTIAPSPKTLIVFILNILVG